MSRYLEPTVYIAGPITGLPDHNTPAFHAAAEAWRRAGWNVVDPRDTTIEGWDWLDYMGHLIPLLLKCHAIANLPGWQESPGAVLENQIAEYMGMHIMNADRPLKPPPQHPFRQSIKFSDYDECCILPDYAHWDQWVYQLRTP